MSEHPTTLEEVGHPALPFTRLDFNPTPADAIVTRYILHGLRPRRININIPFELALYIANLADYNPRIMCRRTVPMEYKSKYHGTQTIWTDESSHGIAGLYLVSPSLPKPPEGSGFKVRIKSAAFQMRSADQGWATWGGEGTYRNSHTWFEVSVLRPRTISDRVLSSSGVRVDADGVTEFNGKVKIADYRETLNALGWDFVMNGEEAGWLVHHNLTASKEFRDYRVDWDLGAVMKIDEDLPSMGDGAGFLESLRGGDAVALWARAEVSDLPGALLFQVLY